MILTKISNYLVPVAIVAGMYYRAATETCSFPTKKNVLVIGASGAIGKKLVQYFLEHDIQVIAAIRKTPLPSQLTNKYEKSNLLIQEFGVDVRNRVTLLNVFKKYEKIDAVWMLAAPLSIEAAQNPIFSHEVVVGGMKNILSVMNESGNSKRICFSDSIGSYGCDAPRLNCTAEWLTTHPKQDPGSEYGKQKRICRELMVQWVNGKAKGIRDSRFAVIPGVLHTDSIWGDGTTEYALDAIKCAINNTEYICPVPPNQYLPMIMRSDLIQGLYKLTFSNNINEPEGGYAMSGLSFTPEELFIVIKKKIPTFKWKYNNEPSEATLFSSLWPDTLSSNESMRDLEFVAKITKLADIVDILLNAWVERRKTAYSKPPSQQQFY
jgi:threonine 3-dehydrogenase